MKIVAPALSRLRKYGMDVADWWALFSAQDGRCVICSKRFGPKRRPCVDHNHRTGEVRALLCSPCNQALGVMHDDADWFLHAWSHLTDPISREVFLTPRIHVDAPPRG